MPVKNFSIVIPAKNEARGLSLLLPNLIDLERIVEIIVVNDGACKDTEQLCQQLGVSCVSKPVAQGNGAAIKTGARIAKGEFIIFMDGDGQHLASDIPVLVDKVDQGYDMVVGARSRSGQANVARASANGFYNRIASWMVGATIEDLTSGFRVVNRQMFLKYLYLLPNKFSYPTTITMAFFRAGLQVAYVPIEVKKRIGVSHLRPLRDGIRFLIIIFKIGTLYSPLKMFLPFAALFFGSGLGWYVWTYISEGRFTNMSATLLSTSIVVFLMGMVSEQITALHYKD